MKSFFLLPIALFFSAAGYGDNKVFNSSFELGTAGHAVISYLPYRSDAIPADVSIDTTTAVHGQKSLRIDNRKAKTFLEYMTAEVFFTPGATCTYSVWLKADRPTRAQLFLLNNQHDTEAGKNYWLGKGQNVQLTTDWKRYSITRALQKPHRKVTLQLELREAAVVWVDAVQFEENQTPSSYAPSAPVEAAFELKKHILFPGKAPIEFSAANYTDRRENVHLQTSCGNFQMILPPRSAQQKTLTFTADRFGIFSHSGTFQSDSGSGRVFPVDYGVVSPLPEVSQTGFFTGLNAAGRSVALTHCNRRYPEYGSHRFKTDGSMTIADHFRNLRLHGIRFLRLHDDGISWSVLEPEKGKFQWDILDTVVESCRKTGLEPMFIFGNGAVVRRVKNDPNKDWFARKNSKTTGKTIMGGNWEPMLPDPKDWCDFLTALVSRYKGKIRYYEIINEPNLVMPDPEHYTRYLKLSWEIIKKIDPEAQVVGICSTGDFNGNVGEYIEAIGKRGGFRYLDILSFHPYDAPLDTSPSRAELQIERIRKLADRYKPNVRLLQDEIYYLVDKPYTRYSHYIDRGRSWPARNLVRRNMIDLAGGLIGSISITGEQIEKGDAGHRGIPYPKRFTLHYTPNEHFVAGNAFARFLEGAQFLAKPDVNTRLNAFIFRDRNGKEAAGIWALDKSGECSFRLPEGIRVCDMFGNPVTGQQILLGEDVLYLFGNDLKQKIESIHFQMKRSFVISGAAESSRNGEMCIAVEFENPSSESCRFEVRMQGELEKQEFELSPESSRILYFPARQKTGEIELLISDDREIHAVRVPVTPHPFAKSGRKEKIGTLAEFTPTVRNDGLHFSIRVNDLNRSPRVPGAPWMEDCIEFFFDTHPDSALGRQEYTSHIYRLFLVPPSSDGKPAELTTSRNIDSDGILWKITNDPSGYSAELLIPWKKLGLKKISPIAFDLIVSDFDAGKRIHSRSWTGNTGNHLNRLNFGRLLEE